MIVLRDNTQHHIHAVDIDRHMPLERLADIDIRDIVSDSGNSILIYPHSFQQCDDEIGKQPIFSFKRTLRQKDRCNGARIVTGNIAGFISIDGTPVTILSRFADSVDKDFFLHYMLQKVLNINIVNLSHGTNSESIFDFLIYLFPKLLNDVLTQGLFKKYIRHEYNDSNVKGCINVSRHIRQNIPFNGNIAYSTREFSHDNRVTELVRHTIEYIRTRKAGQYALDIDADTRANVSQIISATPAYNRFDRDKVISQNIRPVSHPYYTRYAPLQSLCLRILRHDRIKYGNSENKIYGILFDVSYLWEEYLGTILTPHGFKHPNNRKRSGTIYLSEGKAHPRYPDYYNGDSHGVVIDAKYKSDSNRDDENQMLTYMYRLKSRHGIFIYPTNEEKNDECFKLKGFGLDNNALLHSIKLHIPQKAESYDCFKSSIAKSEKRVSEFIGSTVAKTDRTDDSC